jgi:hypothetical protein
MACCRQDSNQKELYANEPVIAAGSPADQSAFDRMFLTISPKKSMSCRELVTLFFNHN